MSAAEAAKALRRVCIRDGTTAAVEAAVDALVAARGDGGRTEALMVTVSPGSYATLGMLCNYRPGGDAWARSAVWALQQAETGADAAALAGQANRNGSTVLHGLMIGTKAPEDRDAPQLAVAAARRASVQWHMWLAASAANHSTQPRAVSSGLGSTECGLQSAAAIA